MHLSLRQLSRRFGTLPAIDDVSLDVASGELVALLGPSGSGKTTLLRLVAGLDAADAGEVHFDGVDAARWPIQQRQVGFVFQHYALFRNLDVFENVAFGLRARPRRARPDAAAIRQRVHALLELVHLPGLERRYPAQLSGGQQQRVALARALAIEPRVLLLDEPFGALDAQVRKELRRWLHQLHAQTRLTTLFVTHDQDEALELADRIVVLRRGRIEQVGTPDEIFEHPATRFVHEFVGESSALAVEVAAGRVLREGMPLAIDAAAVPDGAAWLLVRPQHVGLADEPGGNIAATVGAVLRVGARHRIEALASGGGERIDCEVDARPALVPGAKVYLRLLQARVYRADADPAAGQGAARAAPAD